MGLDQYLTGRKVIFTPYAQSPRTEDDFPIESIDIRLGYWRKHQELHDFMVQQFAKNGVNHGEPIELDRLDLENILEVLDMLAINEEQYTSYKDTFTKAYLWLKAGDPDPTFKPLATEIGTTLQSIGMNVLEFDESTFPVHDVRYVIYRASW